MVPPEEIDKEQPATLPADFGEWDNGEDSAEQSTASSRAESFSGSGGAPRPPARATAARVAVLPVAGRSTNSSARAQVPVYKEVEQVYQPVQSPAGGSKYAEVAEVEEKGSHKKMATFGAIGAIAVLLVGGALGYMKMRPKAVAPNQASGSQTAMTMTDTQKPTAATTAETASTPQTVNTPAAQTVEPAVPLRAQSEAMNKQLNAPSRISGDLKALTGREAPPAADFNAGGVGGMGIGANVFGGQSGPKVKVEAAKKLSITSGVATGLLVQRTTPVYPPLARASHVTGTVVLQATISKNGGVGALRVISGPAMLRQAALDSVKSWRFRPYMLDGEPVEVDTQVNVSFALAQ
jgi:protein TonB